MRTTRCGERSFGRELSRLLLLVGCAVGGTLSWCRTAQAWIYPEHREIGVESWRLLSPEARRFYSALWARAHEGYAARLCAAPVSSKSTEAATSTQSAPCIDYAAWSALAGDHSCSPDELLEQVLPSEWVHDVARVSEQVRRDLAEAHDETTRENLWISSNLLLQDVDAGYVTRAGGNNAHFLLPFSGESVSTFRIASTRQGAPLNALGLYVQYHAAARRLAALLGGDGSGGSSALVRRVLALEAYALHFLQDMYASGHVAGTWGDVATRKGTHDYYCAHGYSTHTWSGRDLVMYGDAHIRKADLERSAGAMARSMGQLLDAAQAAPDGSAADPLSFSVAALDSCKRSVQPTPLPLDPSTLQAVDAVLIDTPVPGRGPDSVAWPRYRADFGPFIHIESSLSTGGAFGGYGGGAGRAVAELGMGVGFGYGLEAVVASVNSGTMYLSVGLVRQSEQVDVCRVECEGLGSSTLPRVPSRAGMAVGLRLPFWLIPGDLLLLTPILALTSPTELTRIAIRAASGGLIPWQRTFSSSAGYFEFVAGRVVQATFHGVAERTRAFAYVDSGAAPEQELAPIGFRSVTLTFPVVEYTPFRTFAQTLTAALQLQLAYAIDLPFDLTNYQAGPPPQDWGPAHMILLRLNLVGRGYL